MKEVCMGLSVPKAADELQEDVHVLRDDSFSTSAAHHDVVLTKDSAYDTWILGPSYPLAH